MKLDTSRVRRVSFVQLKKGKSRQIRVTFLLGKVKPDREEEAKRT